jgi:hypothetical protein
MRVAAVERGTVSQPGTGAASASGAFEVKGQLSLPQ